MFGQTKAFSSFSVDDLQKAKEFYSEVLGLEVTEDADMGLLTIALATGGKVMVYPKGKDHTPATYTILNFPVDSIDEAVDSLIKKGVKFVQYDNEYIKTDAKGVARGLTTGQGPDMAWFTDPSGNIFAVMQEK